MTVNLSIIIVEYKSGIHLNKLLATLPRRKDWEVIVIDNSVDNIGFGAGCNLGAKKAKGKHLLFLNPDVLIDEKNIETMVKYVQTHPKVGVVGPMFMNAKNEVERSSADLPKPGVAAVAFSVLNKLFPHNSISRKYWMQDWNRDTTKTVGVVSGAAMMVRAKEFAKVGMFDPNFFLYWEEFDLCKRMKEHGLSTVFLAESVAKHPREVSMKQADMDVSRIFYASRRRYFAKHFGWPAMALLETWLFICTQWRELSLLAVSLFFRLAKIDRLWIIGDLGRDYLHAFSMIKLQEFSILGIPSSIPRFSQGPFNVWFDAISFLLGGVNVYAPPIFAALLTSFGVLGLYLLLEKRVGRTISFVASLLLALSPAAIQHSRMPFYLFAEPAFLVIYLWSLTRVQATSIRSMFWATLAYWLLFQWELATIPLVLLLPFVFWKKNIAWKRWLIVLPATLLGLLPQIVYDLTHRCAQLCGLFVWSGYRAIAVTGYDGKHGYSPESLSTFISAFWQQLAYLISKQHVLAIVFVCFLILSMVYAVYRKRHDALFVYVCVGVGTLLLGIFLHGSPSEAYFPPFLVFIPVLTAYALKSMSVILRRACLMAILFLCVFNGAQLLHHNFYSPSALHYTESARWIVRTAKGDPVTLRSYDRGAVFASYLDGMKFMIQSQGGVVSDDGVLYVVSLEEKSTLPFSVQEVIAYPNLFVGR